MNLYASLDNIRKLLFTNEECNLEIELLVRICSVNVAKILRNILVEDKTANSCINDLGYLLVADILSDLYLDISME